MKPLMWEEDCLHIGFEEGPAFFDWKNRKTDWLIFRRGQSLPFPDIGEIRFSQPPEEYDLIYSFDFSEKDLLAFGCVPNTGVAPLVNNKVLKLLQDFCPNDIQAFPAVIEASSKAPLYFKRDDYWVINITRCIKAINPEESGAIWEITEKSRYIRKFKKDIVLNDLQDFHGIARDINSRGHIFVSPDLRDIFVQNKVTGVRFLEEDECY